MDPYTQAQTTMQEQFGSTALADRWTATIMADTLGAPHDDFVASRDFFFLATVDSGGMPTVSYKGGPVGLVTVLDPKTVIFPDYDGNGMFLSMGNVADTGQVGMLFIDLETPHRVRVQGRATVSAADTERYPGSVQLVTVTVENTFVNCARYIHKHERVVSSPYVPDAAGGQPLPSWKRLDLVNDVLSPADRDRTEAEGGVIDLGEYATRLITGES